MIITNVVPSRLANCWVFVLGDGDKRIININIENMPVWTFPEQFEQGLFWSDLNLESVDNLADAYRMWIDTIDEYTKDECMIAWQDFCREE